MYIHYKIPSPQGIICHFILKHCSFGGCTANQLYINTWIQKHNLYKYTMILFQVLYLFTS